MIEPTEAQIADACLWYRHDFGLLDGLERTLVMHQAREWLRAWQKALGDGAIVPKEVQIANTPDYVFPIKWVTVEWSEPDAVGFAKGKIIEHERATSVSSAFNEAFGEAYIKAKPAWELAIRRAAKIAKLEVALRALRDRMALYAGNTDDQLVRLADDALKQP